VVHDDLDLPPGSVRLKLGVVTVATTACANTIRQLGSSEFRRLRLGIVIPARVGTWSIMSSA